MGGRLDEASPHLLADGGSYGPSERGGISQAPDFMWRLTAPARFSYRGTRWARRPGRRPPSWLTRLRRPDRGRTRGHERSERRAGYLSSRSDAYAP
jgi:hypothetical protein